MPPTNATSTAPPSPVSAEPPLAPITVPMFTEMLRAGILDRARVYLWNGRLAPRTTTGRPHTICVLRTYHALYDLRIPGLFFVEPEQPMALRLEHTAPYPDVKLVRGRPEDYPTDLPTSADVPMVVEVSDSTLFDDRRKAATYAREGIPVYWIINLIDRVIEVYTQAGAGVFNTPVLFAEDDEVPVIVDGRAIGRVRVRDLLP